MYKLTVFSGKNCNACEVSKRIFFENDIDYEEKMVMQNMQEAKEKGIRSVPCFVLQKGDGPEVIYFGSDTVQTVVDQVLEWKNGS